MINKKNIAIVVLYFTIYSLQAQVRISGSIVDRETKEPVVYATVSFPEQNIGTISDGDGRFSIYIADTTICKSLVFSCIGYQRQSIPVAHLLKEKTTYMKPVVSNLSGVEVKAMSYNALLELTDRVFRKARLNTKATQGKVLYSLESDKDDEPLELVEAFYSGTQSMRYGLEEMKLKNGRIGLNLETDDKIMNISSTNVIINFLPYNIPANNFGLPPMPGNYRLNGMAENFSFFEDGVFREDTASLKKISFYSKSGDRIEGHILFYHNSLQMKQYDIKVYNAENVLFPAIKGDRIDSVNIHLIYTYKKDEKNVGNMLLERINMDYSLHYYSAQSKYYFPVNTSAFFLFYDYENPFNPPFFRDTKLPSDYVKIWEFPYMDAFWQYNYFLPEDEKKEERLLFFEKNGIVKTREDSPFNPDVEELKSPLRAWSKERVDIETTTINSMFSGFDDEMYSTIGVMDLKKLKMNNASYNVDAQIFMDYICLHDSLYFTTKTFINLETSYFLPTPNAYAAAFVNMYFDLYEMSRRNLEQRLKLLPTYNAKEVENIYSEEMKVLNNNIHNFKNGTKDATDIYTLINWWNIINDSLHIDQSQSLLDKPMPNLPYMFDKDEIMLIPAYFYNTGIVLLQLGQYQDAAHYFTKAIEKIIDNKKNAARMAHLYFRRAEAYYHLDYTELFCNDLQKAITLDDSLKEYAKQYLKYCESE